MWKPKRVASETHIDDSLTPEVVVGSRRYDARKVRIRYMRGDGATIVSFETSIEDAYVIDLLLSGMTSHDRHIILEDQLVGARTFWLDQVPSHYFTEMGGRARWKLRSSSRTTYTIRDMGSDSSSKP